MLAMCAVHAERNLWADDCARACSHQRRERARPLSLTHIAWHHVWSRAGGGGGGGGGGCFCGTGRGTSLRDGIMPLCKKVCLLGGAGNAASLGEALSGAPVRFIYRFR